MVRVLLILRLILVVTVVWRSFVDLATTMAFLELLTENVDARRPWGKTFSAIKAALRIVRMSWKSLVHCALVQLIGLVNSTL